MILSATSENIRRVSEALRRGEIVAIPTETVYGLAANALDPQALAKVFAAKERPTFDPLIVHVSETIAAGGLDGLARAGLVDASRLSKAAKQRIEKLMKAFWPGPLTLALPKLPPVPDLATAGLNSVAIRVPNHPIAQAILKESGLPLAAPSANRFGRISPTRAQHVEDELGDRISWIIDGGACAIGVESTVISVSGLGELSLLRPGGISREKIEALIAEKMKLGLSGEKQAIAKGYAAAPAPGMLESHYAPAKPLVLLSKPFRIPRDPSDADARRISAKNPRKLGILALKGGEDEIRQQISHWCPYPMTVRSLSQTGDLAEAARNLFAALRELDQSDVDVLIAEPPESEDGLGHAILDRLSRASLKR